MTDIKFRSDFLRVLQERGFIHQITDAGALDAKAAEGPITAYIGFDATAPSLHAGSLVQIMMLHWLQPDRAPADRANGRRDDQGRRPLGQGRERASF